MEEEKKTRMERIKKEIYEEMGWSSMEELFDPAHVMESYEKERLAEEEARKKAKEEEQRRKQQETLEKREQARKEAEERRRRALGYGQSDLTEYRGDGEGSFGKGVYGGMDTKKFLAGLGLQKK